MPASTEGRATNTPFADRREGGRVLAERLTRFAPDDPLVLGLPRGGVPVAFEVAKELDATLEVFVVRKLGVPGHEELAMGAIASGGALVVNERVVRQLDIGQSEFEAVVEREARELERRERLYRGDREPVAVRDRLVILVDDGLATGASMRAAVEALRNGDARTVVVAVPVAAPETCRAFENVADAIVCARTPETFVAVGQWYRDFSPTGDAEVRDLLAQSRARTSEHRR